MLAGSAKLPRKKKNKALRFMFATTVLMVVLGMSAVIFTLLSIVYYESRVVPQNISAQDEVVIDEQASVFDIVSKLENEGYVKNKIFFNLGILLQSLRGRVESGAYYLSKGMNDWQVLQALANPYMRWVNIPEGLRREEMANILGNKLAWNDTEKRDFIYYEEEGKNLEGYYFPQSYLLKKDASGEAVAEKMISQFEEKIEPKYEKMAKNKVINMETTLKIASLIQREASGKGDMNLISGIIWNRLFNNMTLDIDASLQYIRGNAEDGWWPKVNPDDKNIDSPYNTYKYKGLPPTPIASPGQAAIAAALNPQSTNCLFYIHDRKSRIHCSPTYEGHQKNIEKYLK